MRSSVRFVRLQTYPESESALNYILPVNGLTNFNFYYKPDGDGFLSSGDYVVTYLGSNQTTSYGYDIVTYAPNSGHTNGVQVRAFNSPPSNPLGIHGVVYGQTNEFIAPIPDALIFAVPYFTFGTFSVLARTKGNGYFSFYYKNVASGENSTTFLPVFYSTSPPREYYDFLISGSVNGCNFSTSTNYHYIWQPANTTNTSISNYFVADADSDVDSLVIYIWNCN